MFITHGKVRGTKESQGFRDGRTLETIWCSVLNPIRSHSLFMSLLCMLPLISLIKIHRENNPHVNF